jgi:ligand-binding sensor domain-containing protein/DNA-binding CsgD family transcriptional regulator
MKCLSLNKVLNMKNTIIIILLSLIFSASSGQSTNVGSPFVAKFDQRDFGAGPENFTAAQNSNGKMFFGNGMGVLVFNGNTWELVEVDNRSYVRSLAVDKQDRVYVGAYQEFGYIDSDDEGYYKYVSLLPLLENTSINFADIWKIVIIDDHVFFQSYYGVFEYFDNKIITYLPNNEFVFAFGMDKQFYVGERGVGLMNLDDGHLKLIDNGDFFSDKEIRSLQHYESNQLLIGTREHGIFVYSDGVIREWNPRFTRIFAEFKLNCGVRLDERRFAFGTVQKGIIICDENGNVIDRLTRDEDLWDNDIVGLFADRDKNLWIMSNLGINYGEVSSSYSILASGIGSGYASLVSNNNIYYGTNRGLYYFNKSNDHFLDESKPKLVENTVGQVWSIAEIQNLILLGHHEGAFLIRNGKAEQISFLNGHWQFFELADHPGYVLSGTYTGFTLFRIENNKISFIRKLEGFDESCRISYQDSHGYIWMSHGYKGIYRLKLNSALDAYDEIDFVDVNDGLPSNLNNDIFLQDGNVHITTVDGIYQFNYEDQTIEKNEQLSKYFDFSQSLSKVIIGPDKSIWNFSKGRAGKLTILNDTLFLNDFQALSFISDELISPFENISWDELGNMIVGTRIGFVYIKTKKRRNHEVIFGTEISIFEAIGGREKIEIGCNRLMQKDKLSEIEIPYSNNLIRIGVSANYFSNALSNQFRFKLDGMKSEWSSWAKENTIEFPHLKEGNYQLLIESRNHYFEPGKTLRIEFTINPPWYRTWYAYGSYVVMILFVVGSVVYFINRRLEYLKRVIIEKQREEIEMKERESQAEKEEAERELIQVRNEKLANEVIHKSKELANTTQGIIHKNQILSEIKADLKLMAEESKNVFVQRKIKGLLRKVDKDIENDRSHEIFRDSFDRVHENFINEIKKIHVDLTPKDLRLCSYLRMNLATKEIAPMLNISVRGVEISRYRLRKKLNLEHERNLTEYLMSFQ